MKLKISFKRNPISTLWSTKLTIFQNFPNKLTQSSFVSLKKEKEKKSKALLSVMWRGVHTICYWPC
jgi:hypothetical protein